MRSILLLPGALCAVGLVWVAGCAAGGSTSTDGTGAAGGGATTTTSTDTTTTTSSSSSSSSSSNTGGAATTSSSSSGTGGAGTGGAGTGGTGGMPNPGLPQGNDCTQDSDCASHLCKPVVVGTNPVCVTPCTQNSDCGGNVNVFCEPITAGSTDGYCIPHSPAHCLSCTQDSDCGSLSETCFQAPGDINAACHIDCSIAGDAACPSDYSCTDQTVNGQARKLCRPKGIPTCLDALGGWCDRLQLPQPCVRQNTAGTCLGQRVCLSPSKRFDKCGALAPQCKTDCTAQDPAGCMESFCPGATNTPTNCGMCGTVCPGYQQPNDNVTCQNGMTCTFSCQGENYDVDKNAGNGCEVADVPVGNHTQTSAAYVADVSCNDGNGHTVHFTGTLLSDARVHENAAIVGFDTNSGSAPDWYSINATGGTFCVNDVVLSFSVAGSASPTCYSLTVITDKNTYSCQADGTGNCSMSHSSGQYSGGSVIRIELQKTCGTNVSENVTYTVDGHL